MNAICVLLPEQLQIRMNTGKILQKSQAWAASSQDSPPTVSRIRQVIRQNSHSRMGNIPRFDRDAPVRLNSSHGV